MPDTDDQLMTSDWGRFRLQRLPRRRRETLRAWDAADAYLLNDLAAEGGDPGTLLLVNDAFGALAVSLHRHAPVSWSDSWLAQQATRINLRANGLPVDAAGFIDSLQTPPPADRVLVRLPKSLALLEDQLLRLKPRLGQASELRLAGLQRHMPRRVWALLERIIGPTETLPGWRKAKLIRARIDPSIDLPPNPYPGRYRLEGSDIELINHSALFSREKLDIGTRFLIGHLPRTEGPGDIIDLGCGNGVIGLMAARQNPEARVHFVDESFMAIASARENLRQIDAGLTRCRFTVGNALDGFEPASADLVLCNPPFHQQQAIGDAVVRQMFRQAAQVLRPGGEFWLVANRHLDYKGILKRHFERIEIPASNRKFVIYRAIAG
jgi:16S rRNA (guanine1207-N2)-methyltransferase